VKLVFRALLWMQVVLLVFPISCLFGYWLIFLVTPHNSFGWGGRWPPAAILAPTIVALLSLGAGLYLSAIALIRAPTVLEKTPVLLWWLAGSGVVVALIALGSWYFPGGDEDTFSLVHQYFRDFAWGSVLIPMFMQLVIARRCAKV
jgi:hypothetical protein